MTETQPPERRLPPEAREELDRLTQRLKTSQQNLAERRDQIHPALEKHTEPLRNAVQQVADDQNNAALFLGLLELGYPVREARQIIAVKRTHLQRLREERPKNGPEQPTDPPPETPEQS